MARRRWLSGRRRWFDRARFPVVAAAVDRLLGHRPWLGALPSVWTLWEQVLQLYARDLYYVRPLQFDGWTDANTRAALIYLSNTAPGRTIGPTHRQAHDVIAQTARRVPMLARTSVEALDLALANIAAHVRLTRSMQRIAERRQPSS